MFLAETGLNTQLVRRYGRAATTTRCLGCVPHGHWRTATLLVALRHDRLTAPLLIDGPLDGELFLAYVKECLGPTLQPGDLVIGDNLASHKVAGGARGPGGPWGGVALPARLQPGPQPDRTGLCPNSKRSCGNAPNAPSPACGEPPHKPWTPSLPPFALTSFAMPGMRQIK